MQRAEDANTLWASGQALNAGQLIYEQLPIQDRPAWAVGILEQCLTLVPPLAELEALRLLADEPTQWKQAHAAFSTIRRLTLQAEQAKRTNIYAVILYLAENAAKVIYNASEEPAPFDHDAGHWVVGCARAVVDKASDSSLEERVWSAVISTGSV